VIISPVVVSTWLRSSCQHKNNSFVVYQKNNVGLQLLKNGCMEMTKNQNKFFVSYDYLQILADGYYNIYKCKKTVVYLQLITAK